MSTPPYFPPYKENLDCTNIEVSSGTSIIARFRYWYDTDRFCEEATKNNEYGVLYVYSNGKPCSIWEKGVEKTLHGAFV